MAMPNTQPTLPAEGTYTDAELLFLSEEPKRLFPENQNSNWGLLRRVLSEQPQAATDLLSFLVDQENIATADGYLGRWEEQMGLPVEPTGHTEAQRRNWLSLRRTIDVFSVGRLRATVESFLNFTSGGLPTQLTAPGVEILAPGVTMYGEGGSSTSQYRIYFNPRNFTYEVWVVNTSTPDLTTMTRMLNFITPAGMSFTLDNTKAAIIDYGKTILNKQPSAFFRLADFSDSSGYANNGTSFGTITALASPGLLTAGLNDAQAGKTFDGATGYFTAPDQNYIDFGDRFTIEFWFKPATIAAGQRFIVDKGTNGFFIWQDAATLAFGKSGIINISVPATTLVAGTAYHVVLRKSGPNLVKWTINNVTTSPVLTGSEAQRIIENTATALYVGRSSAGASNYLNGSLDELAIYDRWLSDAEITSNYNAGKAIL